MRFLSKVSVASRRLDRGVRPVNALAESHLSERWTLTPDDHVLIAAKSRTNRLGFAVLLLFFREHGRFPTDGLEIDRQMLGEVARQVHAPAPEGQVLNLSGRTVERHRAEIRALFGYREATVADAEALEDWLRDQAATVGAVPDHLVARLEARCRELAIEPPSADRVERIVRAAIRAHEERLYARIRDRLAPETRARLEKLLQPESDAASGSDGDGQPGAAPALLLRLRGDPGRPSLAGVQAELARLELVRRVGLPADLFDQVLPQELERYRRRVAVEAPHELRRHPEAARLTWLAAFVHLRGRQLTDDLVDLLTETIHRIGARAERRVDRELLDDLKRVGGKQGLLFDLAGAALDHPDGIVREVVFPVVGEQTLRDLVQEAKATGPTYRVTLRTVIRNSYKAHYRRMVPQILKALDFRSNNRRHRPVIQALDLLRRYADTRLHAYPADEDVPIDGVARGLWREAVVEKDAEGRSRVNRITYEICALEALRDKLRCKEVWVVGANRYRNPDDDVPADFEEQFRGATDPVLPGPAPAARSRSLHR
jgi:hypothetical protein